MVTDEIEKMRNDGSWYKLSIKEKKPYYEKAAKAEAAAETKAVTVGENDKPEIEHASKAKTK